MGQIKRRSFKARLLASNDNSIHMARRRKPVVDIGVVVVVTVVVVGTLIADIYIFGKYGNFLTSEIYNTR